MKTILFTASTFAAVSIALLALVLASFGAIPASLALLVFVASTAAFALLASRTVEIQVIEHISIVDGGRVAPSRVPSAVAFAFVALSASAPASAILRPIVVRDVSGWTVEFAGKIHRVESRIAAFSLAYELENGRGIVGGKL